MATVDLGAAAPLVNELHSCHLLAPEHLAQIRVYLRTSARPEPARSGGFPGPPGHPHTHAGRLCSGRTGRRVGPVAVRPDRGNRQRQHGRRVQGASTKTDAWYALKIVPRRNVLSVKTVAEKVKALRTIRHRAVSALLHLGAAGERVYLAWPLLEGGEKLDDFVRRQGQLTPKQTIQIGLQAASGLLPYHQNGLFHGLLKPSDILIGADRRVRILDFGVGFLLTSERGKSLLDTMTNTRAGAGTRLQQSRVDHGPAGSHARRRSVQPRLHSLLLSGRPVPFPARKPGQEDARPSSRGADSASPSQFASLAAPFRPRSAPDGQDAGRASIPSRTSCATSSR